MKRLFIIRHIRYFYLRWKFMRWWRSAKSYWLVPNELDFKYLKDVWEGKA